MNNLRQTPGVRYLSAQEGASWKSKIEKAALRAATPLRFCLATGDDMPMPLEVVRNDKGVVIIHFFRRPDVPQPIGELVVAEALTAVLGAEPEGTECFYRDEKEIMKQNEWPRPMLESDSWYVEFTPNRSAILPTSDMIKDRLAFAVKAAYSKAVA